MKRRGRTSSSVPVVRIQQPFTVPCHPMLQAGMESNEALQSRLARTIKRRPHILSFRVGGADIRVVHDILQRSLEAGRNSHLKFRGGATSSSATMRPKLSTKMTASSREKNTSLSSFCGP
jgi:hypothetical protein